MPLSVRGIFSKNKLTNEFTDKRIRKWLEGVAKEFREEMQVYPPVKPWKNGFPTSGVRRGGHRTGKYRRGWDSRSRFDRDSVTVINNVSYAVYVGGSRRSTRIGHRQAIHMRERDWKSVTNVSHNVVRRNRRKLQKALLPYRNVRGL